MSVEYSILCHDDHSRRGGTGSGVVVVIIVAEKLFHSTNGLACQCSFQPIKHGPDLLESLSRLKNRAAYKTAAVGEWPAALLSKIVGQGISCCIS